MFSKYVSKITNTIGAINYIQQKSKKDSEKQQYSHWQHSPKQKFYDEGLDVIVDNEPNNNHINCDLSTNYSRTHTQSPTSIESQLILTAAIEKLRNTLFRYELV